jgi:hypothetical protein
MRNAGKLEAYPTSIRATISAVPFGCGLNEYAATVRFCGVRPSCHSERSEESPLVAELLRSAPDDGAAEMSQNRARSFRRTCP